MTGIAFLIAMVGVASIAALRNDASANASSADAATASSAPLKTESISAY